MWLVFHHMYMHACMHIYSAFLQDICSWEYTNIYVYTMHVGVGFRFFVGFYQWTTSDPVMVNSEASLVFCLSTAKPLNHIIKVKIN